jgi:D-3-phosphoglycerate dehydrogenase / 2-oxoglutarate reductase
VSVASATSRRALEARERGDAPSVFVHEMLDPSGASLAWLEQQGVKVERGCPTWGTKFLTEDELIARGRGHVALMGASTHPITARVLESLPEVAYISKYGIGVDSIDMEAATRLGVLVTNTPIAENWEAVAEWTVAAMLALRKQFLFYTTERLRQGGWRTADAWSRFMRGSTVGIVGLGRIGRSVVQRLRGWNCRLIAHDPYVEDGGEVEMVSLEQLLRESDVISLHPLLTAETRHMINRESLSLVRDGAVLVNSARGGLVDLDAVDEALRSGRLAGVAMDAYATEPPPVEHPVFTNQNVIATPHASAWVEETFEAIARTGAENVHAALSGEMPRFAVNPEVLA